MATMTDSLALRIDRRRVELGLTVLDLAAASYIPLTTLQRRLIDAERLSLGELRNISRALEVPVSSWFEVAA